MTRMMKRYNRVYIDGRDYSGDGMTIGPAIYDANPVDMTVVMSDPAHGFLPDQPKVTPSRFDGILDNTAVTGLFTNITTGGTGRVVTAIIGGIAAPVIGSPCFNGAFIHDRHETVEGGGMAIVALPFGDWDEVLTAGLNYRQPWGNLLHPMGAETGVNSANTNVDGGGSTSLGGVMWYHLTSYTGGTGPTLLVQDSADGSTGWTNVAGMTVTLTTQPTAGFVALGPTATIREFTRWQIVLNAATTVTFGLSLVRGNGF